jgi:hypothetical protein
MRKVLFQTVGRKEDTYYVSDNQTDTRNTSNTRTNISTRTKIPEVSYSRAERTNASNSEIGISKTRNMAEVKRLSCKFEYKGNCAKLYSFNVLYLSHKHIYT